MTSPMPTIRRRANGTIDVDYYHGNAQALRRQARCDIMGGGRKTVWALAAAAVLLVGIAVTVPRQHYTAHVTAAVATQMR